MDHPQDRSSRGLLASTGLAAGQFAQLSNLERLSPEHACSLADGKFAQMLKQLGSVQDVFRSLPSHLWGLPDYWRFSGIERLADLGRLKTGLDTSVIQRAIETAGLAGSLPLPSALAAYQTAVVPMTLKLLQVQAFGWWRAEHLDVFNQTSAFSDMLSTTRLVGSAVGAAAFEITGARIPSLAGGLAEYRGFLDAAGLVLPRWPRIRRLTIAEKRKRFKDRLKTNAEDTHVRKAKSLVHGYELTLREILELTLADEYGEDWHETRLPFCDCTEVLSRWRRRGGSVLDHADYVHYARIMGSPEHFEAIFSAGFEDPESLQDLILRAGRLRAASHHARPFTHEDLRDLRVIWRTIEAGLILLTDQYTIDP